MHKQDPDLIQGIYSKLIFIFFNYSSSRLLVQRAKTEWYLTCYFVCLAQLQSLFTLLHEQSRSQPSCHTMIVIIFNICVCL